MLLKDILEEADLLVNNSLSVEQRVRLFNQVQRSIYRDYPLEEKANYFQTIPGQIAYNLPADCDPDFIISLFLNDSEYHYVTASDLNTNNIYTITNNQLMIQPTPSASFDAYLYYKSKPVDVTVNDLDKEVPFLKDFPQVFILGIAQRLALVAKDYKTASELEARFQNAALDASVKLTKIRMKKVRIVRGWF